MQKSDIVVQGLCHPNIGRSLARALDLFEYLSRRMLAQAHELNSRG